MEWGGVFGEIKKNEIKRKKKGSKKRVSCGPPLPLEKTGFI